MSSDIGHTPPFFFHYSLDFLTLVLTIDDTKRQFLPFGVLGAGAKGWRLIVEFSGEEESMDLWFEKCVGWAQSLKKKCGPTSSYSIALTFLIFVFGFFTSNANKTDPELVSLQIPVSLSRPSFEQEVFPLANQISTAFGIDQEEAMEFGGWILEASDRQNLPTELLASLIFTESSFRKHVSSSVGAIGPAQVRPDLWSDFCGGADLYDPEQNIYCGAQILRHFYERCEDNFDCALSAYNVGLNGTNKFAANRYLRKVDLHVRRLTAVSFRGH